MSIRDYQREMDLLVQKMMDRQEQALLARLREACPKADEEDARLLLQALVDQAVKDGLRRAAALTWAMSMLERGLDADLFEAKMEVKS